MRRHALGTLMLFAMAAPLAAQPVNWAAVTDQATVSRAIVQDAAAAVIAGRNVPKEHTARVELLRKNKVLRGREDERPDEDASRGYACLLFARVLGERQSVMFRLLGSNERYAYKHLEFLQLIPSGGAAHRISGGELVSMLGLARKRRAGDAGGDQQ